MVLSETIRVIGDQQRFVYWFDATALRRPSRNGCLADEQYSKSPRHLLTR
jgi:hypothetical protein